MQPTILWGLAGPERINSNLGKHNETGREGPGPRISVHYDWIPFHHYQSDWIIRSSPVQPSMKLSVCEFEKRLPAPSLQLQARVVTAIEHIPPTHVPRTWILLSQCALRHIETIFSISISAISFWDSIVIAEAQFGFFGDVTVWLYPSLSVSCDVCQARSRPAVITSWALLCLSVWSHWGHPEYQNYRVK